MVRLQRQALLAALLALLLRGADVNLAAAAPASVAPAAAAAPTTAPAAASQGHALLARITLNDVLGDQTRMIQVAAVVVILAIFILVRK